METECSLCGSHDETMRPRFDMTKPVVKNRSFFFEGVPHALRNSAEVCRAGITNPSTSRKRCQTVICGTSFDHLTAVVDGAESVNRSTFRSQRAKSCFFFCFYCPGQQNLFFFRIFSCWNEKRWGFFISAVKKSVFFKKGGRRASYSVQK